MREKTEILECTLRDGANLAKDSQFTARETVAIASGLEAAGFERIEIGHSRGLNAPRTATAPADHEYLEVTSSVLKRARFGMFFMPEVGNAENLRMASEHGMGFLRVGTNVTETYMTEEPIRLAKDLGMEVMSFLMKSYAFSVDKVVEQARMVEHYGADVITLADSAGGMVPSQVKEYIRSVKKNVGVLVGFHGHNNLGLAIANTLAAIEVGATLVDSTLLGIGRSAGNAQTEVLLCILKKIGCDYGNIDLYKTMDLGESVIRPLIKLQGRNFGIDHIDAVMGYAEFHSSFLKFVSDVAREYKLDPRDLIVKVSEKEKVSLSKKLVLEAAHILTQNKRTH